MSDLMSHSRREFPQLVSDHILCYAHIVVDLAIMNLEDEADKVGKNGCASGLRLDRRDTLAGLWSYNGKTVKERLSGPWCMCKWRIVMLLGSSSLMQLVREIVTCELTGRCEGLRVMLAGIYLEGLLTHIPFHTERPACSMNVGRIVLLSSAMSLGKASEVPAEFEHWMVVTWRFAKPFTFQHRPATLRATRLPGRTISRLPAGCSTIMVFASRNVDPLFFHIT